MVHAMDPFLSAPIMDCTAFPPVLIRDHPVEMKPMTSVILPITVPNIPINILDKTIAFLEHLIQHSISCRFLNQAILTFLFLHNQHMM